MIRGITKWPCFFFSWQNSTSIDAGWKLEMSDKLLILQFDRSIFSHCQFLSSVTLTLEDTAVTRQRWPALNFMHVLLKMELECRKWEGSCRVADGLVKLVSLVGNSWALMIGIVVQAWVMTLESTIQKNWKFAVYLI